MSHAMDAVGRACCYTYVLSDCGSTRTDVEFMFVDPGCVAAVGVSSS